MIATAKAYQPILLATALLFSVCLHSQTGSFSLKKYTVKDGLPDNYIFRIFQDSRNFLWIGSQNGISRFDGKNFINYGFANKLPGLGTDFIYEDDTHQIWAGTRLGAAVLKGNSFHEYPVSDAAAITFVFQIIETGEKELWLLTDKGVYRFEKDHWQKIILYPGMDNKPCRRIIETEAGMYINFGSLLVLKHGDGRFEILDEQNSNPIFYDDLRQFNSHVYVTKNKRLYKIEHNRLIPVFSKALAGKTITSYFEDSKKQFWVVTPQNGVILATNTGNGEKIIATLPVPFNLVSHIFEDMDHNIWIACYDGLGKVVQKKYAAYEAAPGKGINYIRNILQTSGGSILAFSQGNGFLTFKDNHFVPSLFKLPIAKNYQFNNDVIDTYSSDFKGALWFVTRKQRLFSLYHNKLTDHTAIAGNTFDLLDACWDNRSNRLFIMADSLLIGNESSQQPFASNNGSQKLFQPITGHCFANGLSIFSTRHDGNFLIDTKNNLTDITHELGIKKSLINFLFLEEKNSNFWIYKELEGLCRYHWTKDKLPKKNLEITTANGLPNNAVNSMCIDKYNRVWVTTLAGLSIIRIDTLNNNNPVFYNPGYDLDVAPEHPVNSKLIAAADGMVWLSTLSKIYRFNPDDIQFRNIIPSISIERVTLLTKENPAVKTDSLLEYFWQSSRPAIFSYDQNSFRISFTGIAYNNSFELQYSYKLGGLDSNWSIPTVNNNVSYVNLQSGNYFFEVKVKKADSDWSKPAVFLFTIRKAFWETWWFRLLTVLAASGIIVFAFRYRLNEVKTKAALKNQLQELESKALKAQMNPHFIFNAMNSIQSLIINNRTEEAGSYISKFARLMRQVLENADNNLVTISKELYSLQLYISLEKLRLDVDLNYSEDIDPDIDILHEKIPSLLLQPFIENALWHGLSKKEGSKNLTLKISASEFFITCEITDNGIGRSMAAQNYQQLPEGHLSKATQITKDRLIGFNKDKGIIPLEIIDLKNSDGQPAGTTVLLRIKRSLASR